MKTFQEFILESSCVGSPKGMDCPVHGSEKCPKVKSHKTVEEIAKKHRLDVSFVKNQLEMGIPIEHEHTKDKTLATDIALQHLNEIPDYYTRLKKMESSAKKEHKKFKDVKEESTSDGSLSYQWDTPIHDELERYCPGCQKNEERHQCKYGVKFWDLYSYPTKLAKVYEGTLHFWYQGSSGTTKTGRKTKGWVQADGSPCANEPGETGTPKCFSSGRLRALKKKGKKGLALIRSAVRRKKQKDKGQQQKSGAAAPTNVPTFAKGKKDKNYVEAEPGIRESIELNEAQKDKPGKGSGTKDACYHKVKSRYRVWPSAYASGALVKCRKVGADNWGTKSESYLRIQSRGSTYSILLNWRGRPLTAQMFFPQFARPSKEQVTYEIRKIYPGAIVLSFNPALKDPTKPLLFTGDENESRRH